ncbi:hypothetical protein CHS0354_042996 [Potamilus streckersoni]|uniref:EGF-like domain-containing protein n=1 Tax=Potamilus streckersoni TaxID=2493646 RepID=A0AAE0W5U1_9BIVA|nr:hypothetical protein CHS0354_042996 [Potamilus streckersoni]
MNWKMLAAFMLVFLLFISQSKAWSGNVCTRKAAYWVARPYCIIRYWWGCSAWRNSWVLVYYTVQYCCPGWTHNGNNDCIIPICYPTCKNGGTCTGPNSCSCPDLYTGPTCETKISMNVKGLTVNTDNGAHCSYLYPCYPGDCVQPNNCTCFKGFGGTPSSGCKDIISNDEKPQLGKVTAILANLKKTTNERDDLQYVFVADATNDKETQIVWSNQNQFNLLSVEFESMYMTPGGFPLQKPAYVYDYGIGIVKSSIHVILTKINQNDGPTRNVCLDRTYNCSGFSYLTPIFDTTAKCYIKDDQFSPLIANGDWLTITFQAENGGFRTRVNTDNGTYLPRDMVIGMTDSKRVEFKFDFEAATHCSEKIGTCQEKPLAIAEDISKKPIEISWGGWSDDLAGMWQYYLEIFKLSPDLYGRLVEMEPLKPVYTEFINESDPHYATFTPKEPGMYSVLLEARDMANNSKITRRLCLYDNVSTVEIDTTEMHSMYIATAAGESGFMWQGSSDVITVVWSGHFFNRIHNENKLLSQVLSYPVQFADVEDNGILSSRKYVYSRLDDEEGSRSINEITNLNGIVRFEVNEDFADSATLPIANWKDVSPFAENYTFQAKLFSGRKMKVWVRAYDIMGNNAFDFTELNIDRTPPSVGIPEIQRNYQNGAYKYCSRFTFSASDDESGVHTIEYKLIMKDTGEVKYTGKTIVNFSTDLSMCQTETECTCKDKICFKINQVLDINNCWFLTHTDRMKSAAIIVQVFVYNQAWIASSFSWEVTKLYTLDGLTEMSGPKKIMVSSKQTNGVRLNWELPDSCYGETDLLIEIIETGAKYRVTKEVNFVDVLGLDEGKTYTARICMLYQNDDLGHCVSFTFATAEKDDSDHSAPVKFVVTGVIGGI